LCEKFIEERKCFIDFEEVLLMPAASADYCTVPNDGLRFAKPFFGRGHGPKKKGSEWKFNPVLKSNIL
jgi:hypothetical protein